MEGVTARAALVRRRDWGTAPFAACALAAALLAWPVQTIAPGVGSDWGWMATLSYAAEHGLRYGSQLVWTYGPLGFLATPYGPRLYYADVFALTWLYAALLQLLFAGTLLAALRRALPLAAAALVTAFVVALTPETAVALGFCWCVLLVLRDSGAAARDAARRVPSTILLPSAIGALAGVALLGKLNQGVELLALALVALVTARRGRDAAAFAAALLLTAALGWVATGQRFADVWRYVRNCADMIAGYAAAMGMTDPRPWTIPAALAVGALALAVAWDAGRGGPRRRRWGLVTLCVAYLGFNFKEGFVLQDTLHMTLFFGDVLGLFALLLAHGRRRLPAVAGMAAAAVAFGAVLGAHEFARMLDPYANAKAAVGQVRTLASPAREDAVLADLQRRIAALYQLAPALAADVGHRPVMFWPYLYGEVAYAYGLRLQPLVTEEPYATFTPRLDRLSARALAERGPPRILRGSMTAAPAIDGRFATFEAPLSTLQIFCRYRHVASEEPWEVLVRMPNRCVAPRRLGSAAAGWGDPVPVPPPRRRKALVLVEIGGAGAHGLERLREAVLRPQRRWISLDGEQYRLIAATAPDGLLLSAPRGADYPAQFAMAPDPREVAVGRDGGEPGGTLRYTFVEVALRRFAHSSAR